MMGFFFSSPPALGPTQFHIQWVPRALTPEVKGSGSKVDHSPPSTTEVENAWSSTSTPQYAFMAWCFVKFYKDVGWI